jgi:hypothetical protein
MIAMRVSSARVGPYPPAANVALAVPKLAIALPKLSISVAESPARRFTLRVTDAQKQTDHCDAKGKVRVHILRDQIAPADEERYQPKEKDQPSFPGNR